MESKYSGNSLPCMPSLKEGGMGLFGDDGSMFLDFDWLGVEKFDGDIRTPLSPNGGGVNSGQINGAWI